jgi:hypothetical protein
MGPVELSQRSVGVHVVSKAVRWSRAVLVTTCSCARTASIRNPQTRTADVYVTTYL